VTGPVDARHEHAHPWRATFTLLLPALWSFIALILALATLAGAAVALLRGERGTAWLLTNLPGVEARGVTGALLGERFGVEHLSFSVRPGLERLTLEGVQAEGMRWTWRPPARGWVGVQVAKLSARRVVILTGTGSGEAPVLPQSLRLPLAADFDRVTVGELQIDRLSPILDIQAQGALGALNGTQHRVDELRFRWDRIAVSAAGDVGTAAPFALSAQIDLAPAQADAPPWGGRVLVRGPLEALDVRGRLRGSPQVGQEAPWLDVVATVRPLDPWPLSRLEGRTEGLDLSTLASGLPRTRLDGEASVNARTLDAPVQATLNITNGVPGRWDRGSLPVAALNLDIDLDLRRPDQVQIGRFELQLAGDGGSAGRASGTGRWEGDTLKLNARVDDLRPQRLHGQAPATRVSGPLTFTLRGLPVGWASAAASAPGGTPEAPGLGFDLQGTLQGTLDAAPQPVTLTFDLGWTPDSLQLRTLSAQAGNARAEAMAVLTRQGRRWQLSTRGELIDVEPEVWWPGPEDSAWRRGPHRLSADWALGLLLPANAEELARTAPLQLLQTLVGTGQLRLRPSLLAGVPVSGEVLMAQRAALGGNAAPPVSPQATSAPSRVQADLRVGSNRLTLQGEGDPLGTGQDDQTTLTLKAPALRELAPLAALLPALAPWAPRSGDVQAEVTVQGRWPDARSQGTARLAGVQVGSLSLRDGNARWALDTRSEAPLDLTLSLNDLKWDRQRLQALALTLQGTPAPISCNCKPTCHRCRPCGWKPSSGNAPAPARGPRCRPKGAGAATQWATVACGAAGCWRCR
jgi:translocation and assembly module TamB